VDTRADFSTPSSQRFVDTFVQHDTTTFTQTFTTEDTYYWRVRAQDNATNTSAWSDTRVFRYDVTAPDTVELLQPARGEDTNASPVEFVWSQSSDDTSGVGRYFVEVDTDPGFGGPVFSGFVEHTTTDTTFLLTEVDTYYWRVYAEDNATNTSAWSDSRVFRLDQTAPDTGIRVIETVVEDGLEVRDITVSGEHDSGTWGPGRFAISDPDGSGLVEGFEVPDGGAWEDETPNAGNLWRGPSGIVSNINRGTLRFADCVLGGFPDNGLYAAGSTGKIIVDGGFRIT
jgi:hypothetical protein